MLLKMRCAQVRTQALLLLLGVAWNVYAQVPGADRDSWIRFPARPREEASDVAPKVTSVDSSSAETAVPQEQPRKRVPSTATNAPIAESAVSPSPKPPTSVESSAAVARDGWIRFPLRSSAPVAPVTQTATRPPESAPTTKPTVSTTVATPVAPPVTLTPEVPPAVTAKVPEPTVAPVVQEPVQEAKAPEKAQRIVGFRLVGNEEVASQEILRALKSEKGKEISMDNLRHVTDLISQLYRGHAMLALVEMPEQDLTDGMVQVQITESHFSGLTVQDPQGVLKNNAQLPKKIVEHDMPVGEVLSLEKLDTATVKLNEVPGVQATISLRAGEAAGQTQAVAVLEPAKAVQAEVGLDNAGAHVTGEIRETAKLTVNNPLKLGDALVAQALHSEGLDFAKIGYSVPVGGDGWRVGVNTSALRYQVVASELQYLNAKGPSNTVGVEVSKPIVRDEKNSVTVQISADSKHYQNEALDTVQSNYSGTSATAYVEASHKQEDGTQSTGSVQLVQGNINMSGSTALQQLDDSTTTQTAGNYTKLRLSLQHAQTLDDTNKLVTSFQSQWASKNLDSSEKFFLGGAQGVRAYPANEAGGSIGQLFSLEWQKRTMVKEQPVTFATFYDAGHVVVNKFNDFAGASALNQYSLSGVGFWGESMFNNRWGGLSLRLTYSHRLGINPGASSLTGLDQDGTLVINRLWFSLTQTF